MMRSNAKLIKIKVYCETRTQKKDANKDRLIKFGKKILLFFTADFSHFLSQIFWHFFAKNCDKKVTQIQQWKKIPGRKKKKKSPPVAGGRRTDARVQPFWGNVPVLGGGGLCCTYFRNSFIRKFCLILSKIQSRIQESNKAFLKSFDNTVR
jgi:hypothetical protein